MDKWHIIFRSLTLGAKFDFVRFHDVAGKLKLLKPNNQKPLPESRTEVNVKTGNEAANCKRSFADEKSAPAAKKRKIELESKAQEDTEDEDDIDVGSSIDGDDSSDYDDEEMEEDTDDSGEEEGEEEDGEEDEEDDDESGTDDDEDDSSQSNCGDEDDMISDEELTDEKSLEKPNKNEAKLANKHENKQEKLDKVKDKSVQKLAQIKQEEMNHFRNERYIHVYGEDIPNPITTFEQLAEEYKIHPKILENLKTMGFMKPTEIETQAIPVMLDRREIMACAPTGSGKTLAFVLPILHHLKEPTKKADNIRALVLAPTIELAKQIRREFNRVGDGLGFHIQFIEKVTKMAKRAATHSNKIDVLITTPNRLVHLMKDHPSAISLESVEWLVIDECDKLFEEGKNAFRDQLGTIYKACSSKSIRRGLFSATFANDVKEWCLLNLDNVIQVCVGARNSATHNIEQELIYVGNEAGKLIALRDIIHKGFQPPILIFVQSKERGRDLFKKLAYENVSVEVIHGDKTQSQRDAIVESYRCGKIWVLICTEVMGRGIDFKGVNLVINYDFPNSAISYIHRIGRTGRAGRHGKAITFVADCDMEYLRSIVNVMREAGCPVPDYMLRIKPIDKKEKKRLAKSAIPREAINEECSMSEKMKKKELLEMKEEKKLNPEKKNDRSIKKSKTPLTGNSKKRFGKKTKAADAGTKKTAGTEKKMKTSVSEKKIKTAGIRKKTKTLEKGKKLKKPVEKN